MLKMYCFNKKSQCRALMCHNCLIQLQYVTRYDQKHINKDLYVIYQWWMQIIYVFGNTCVAFAISTSK